MHVGEADITQVASGEAGKLMRAAPASAAVHGEEAGRWKEARRDGERVGGLAVCSSIRAVPLPPAHTQTRHTQAHKHTTARITPRASHSREDECVGEVIPTQVTVTRQGRGGGDLHPQQERGRGCGRAGAPFIHSLSHRDKVVIGFTMRAPHVQIELRPGDVTMRE
jgi:hypothetical protein